MNLTLIRNILLHFKVRMSTTSQIIFAPTSVRGMKCLDREKFTRTITVPVLKVSEENLSHIVKLCKQFFLKLEQFKPVQNLTDDTNKNLQKCIYFDPEKITNWHSISEDIRTSLHICDIDENNFDLIDFKLTYNHFKYDAIFKAVLPENEEFVSGFSQIGHIIHLNLRDHLLEYRSLIGQVLVDKIKTCRTVVNKIVTIDNEFRNFNMEVIAGDEDFLVTVRENKCHFDFDFSKVYWNPRLGKEHERILALLKPGDVLFDVFSGVGPFAIPAAKNKCRVFANDLNPESYKWLNHNAKKNKLKLNMLRSFNMDGKHFIRKIFRVFILNIFNGREKLEDGAKIHVTMNLPASAVEFLKSFERLIEGNKFKDNLNIDIIIHIYCFTTGDDRAALAKEMVIKNIGSDVTPDIIEVFCVRNVSPKKEMMRVSFKLTNNVIFDDSCTLEEDTEPPSKVQCTRNLEE